MAERQWRMLLAKSLVRLWAAAAIRAELVELSGLLLERTDHLVAPLDWPFLADGEPALPVPLKLHGRYSRSEVFAAFGLLNEARSFPGREGVFFDEASRCEVFFITLKKSERLFSPPPATTTTPFPALSSTGRARASAAKPQPPASAPSTTESAAAECCCWCGRKTGAVASRCRSCAWALPIM
ncbi:hypothetical protein [Synechococcus sp. CS-1327]|uniref:hypothetical protein n=1 Tax=Synechococcus sp. CS-1327 TaxID=2847977 RepID=UPI00223BEB39|nr:hypothetical protein [Synechococcus sp. CS-1327]MCT0213270.1 hypothetical protein [Synechococcus sp. CS-1326]MCT0231917.1 hypothetical protein [Synechococcus sp. CS-1327]